MKYVLLILMLLLTACSGGSAKTPVVAKVDLVPLTVALVVTEDNVTRSYCSGVWVSKNEILTAAHCVRVDPLEALMGMDTGIKFLTHDDLFPGGFEARYPKSRSAVVARRDDGHDLALLRTDDAPEVHPVAELGDSAVETGQSVLAMGHSRGLWFSFSAGHVAAVRFMALDSPPMFWIQTTTPTSPGNSGCGLFDEAGGLVGIASRQYLSGQNLNFYVHRVHLRDFLARG